MAGEAGKEVYRRFVEEVVNNGNFDLIDELYHPDYVDHAAPPGAPKGTVGVRAIMGMFRSAFPDVHFNIDLMVGEDDMVATFVTGEGTNDGPFMGRPPSGKHATWHSTGFFRVRDGRIVEHWGVPDLLAIMTQIGAIPGPGGGHRERKGMTAEEANLGNRSHREWLEGHNPAIVDEIYAEDCVIYSNHIGRNVRFGREGFKAYGAMLYTAFPDLKIHHDMVVTDEEGRYQMILWAFTGTHLGPMGQIPPTGRKVSMSGIDVFRIADGKIKELYLSQDALGLMQQLGVIPTPGQS